jgi:hypothetical protein
LTAVVLDTDGDVVDAALVDAEDGVTESPGRIFSGSWGAVHSECFSQQSLHKGLDSLRPISYYIRGTSYCVFVSRLFASRPVMIRLPLDRLRRL